MLDENGLFATFGRPPGFATGRGIEPGVGAAPWPGFFAAGFGAPGFGAPGLFAAGFGAPGLGAPGFGAPPCACLLYTSPSPRD